MGEKWDLTQILTSISEKLHSSADPVKAQGMSAYMRNQFEFLGIATPLRRNSVNNTLKRYSTPSEQEVVDLARALHELPQRDLQHAGVDALIYHRKLIGPAFIGEPADCFINHKSWWDSVDALNPLIRRLVQTHTERLAKFCSLRPVIPNSSSLRRSAGPCETIPIHTPSGSNILLTPPATFPTRTA